MAAVGFNPTIFGKSSAFIGFFFCAEEAALSYSDVIVIYQVVPE
jgi:hypothetical protein